LHSRAAERTDTTSATLASRPPPPFYSARDVRTLDELAPLIPRGILPRPEVRGKIRLAFPMASDEENAAWQRRLLRHARACGCEVGAIALVLTGLASLGARQTLGIHLVSHSKWDIVAWIGIAVVTSLVAKLLAILHARQALRQLHREIASHMTRRTA
jgi:hypothetical protein